MPDNKARKIIKYGETPEEPEKPEVPGKPEEPEKPELAKAYEEAVRREEEALPDLPVPEYFEERDVPEQPERHTREELRERTEERRGRIMTDQIRNKRMTVLIFVLVFALLATMCGKDIVRLKAENVALKRQQAALKKERDELKAELENTTEQEYIRDQARKQLKLLNPGELLFVWDE